MSPPFYWLLPKGIEMLQRAVPFSSVVHILASFHSSFPSYYMVWNSPFSCLFIFISPICHFTYCLACHILLCYHLSFISEQNEVWIFLMI